MKSRKRLLLALIAGLLCLLVAACGAENSAPEQTGQPEQTGAPAEEPPKQESPKASPAPTPPDKRPQEKAESFRVGVAFREGTAIEEGLAAMEEALNRPVEAVWRLPKANAVSVMLTEAELEQVRSLPCVRSAEREQLNEPNGTADARQSA